MRVVLAFIFALLGTQAFAAEFTGSPITGLAAMTVGTTYTPARGIVAVCTVAGNATVTFVDLSSVAIPVVVGFNYFNFAAVAIASQTATCTYYHAK